MKKGNCLFPRILLKLNGVCYGKKLVLRGFPVIFRDSGAKLILGAHVTINSSFLSNLVGLYQRTIIVAKKKATITIADRVGISGASIYAWNSIEIGEDSLIGANCKIIDTDFHPVDPEKRLQGDNEAAKTSPIKIGKNVFIGMNSIILKGTVLGDNCVVGAGTVVSGEFPAGSVIAGNPARVIRMIDSDQQKV